MQSALRLLFPPQCIACGEPTVSDFGLCGTCWRKTPFISGLVCDRCGMPLPGEEEGRAEYCDDCLTLARPWVQGRSALLYRDNARNLVLALKHGDRLELARPAGLWLLRAARPILREGMLVAPVPLHWTRLVRRRFNQSAVLSKALAREAGLDHCPDLLLRVRQTPSQDGRNREERFANVAGAIRVHPRRGHRIAGRDVLLVDDVMTSGATLAAAADACLAAGAESVSVVTLARVAKDA
ncbi:MAG: double zinc ribbon domain-containing protein [Albidovulum sp.]